MAIALVWITCRRGTFGDGGPDSDGLDLSGQVTLVNRICECQRCEKQGKYHRGAHLVRADTVRFEDVVVDG